jgi:hypothetical protein
MVSYCKHGAKTFAALLLTMFYLSLHTRSSVRPHPCPCHYITYGEDATSTLSIPVGALALHCKPPISESPPHFPMNIRQVCFGFVGPREGCSYHCGWSRQSTTIGSRCCVATLVPGGCLPHHTTERCIHVDADCRP